MIKLLVVEDHALVRDGLLQTLVGAHNDWVIAGAANAEDAMTLLEADPDIDILLLDLMLPGMSGSAFLGIVRKRFPTVSVIILSALDDNDTVKRMLAQGAFDFVTKTSTSEVLVEAIEAVLAGEVSVPVKYQEAMAKPSTLSKSSRNVPKKQITPAQYRVMELVAEGKTNKEIAELLELSPGTVKLHVSAIFRAYGVTSRTQALNAFTALKAPTGGQRRS